MPGVRGVYASSSNPRATIQSITRVIRNMQDLDIPLRPGRWWRRFLNQFELDHLMQQMTSEGQAEALAQAYLYFGDVDTSPPFSVRISVTPT